MLREARPDFDAGAVGETLWDGKVETVTVGDKVCVPYDCDAGRLPEARGDADAVSGAVGEGELEGLRDAEALDEGEWVAEGEATGAAVGVDSLEVSGVREAARDAEPSADGVREAPADFEAEAHPDAELEPDGRALKDAVGLPRGDAEALRGAEALAIAGEVLTREDALPPCPLAEAQKEGTSLEELEGVAGEVAVPSGLLPLPACEGSGDVEPEALPLSERERGGDSVAPAAVLLPLCDALAVALPEAPSPEEVPIAESVAGSDALSGALGDTMLGEPVCEPEGCAVWVRETIAVALSEAAPDAAAVKDCPGAEGVSAALPRALMEAHGDAEKESALLAVGGGERLAEGQPDGEGDALALPDAHRDAAGEADTEVLGEAAREAGGEPEALWGALACAESEGLWLPLRLASGVREPEPLPLPSQLALGEAVPQKEGAPDTLRRALRPADGEARSEGGVVGEARADSEPPEEGEPRRDDEGGGEGDSVPRALPGGVAEVESEKAAVGCPLPLPLPLGEEEGGAMLVDTRAEGLIDAPALAEAARPEGERPPLTDGRLLIDGATLPLKTLPLEDTDGEGGAVRDPEPPAREGVPQEDAAGEGLAERGGVAEPLAQPVPLPAEEGVGAPLALEELVLDGAPPEGDGSDEAVPAPLPVTKGVAEADALAQRDGAPSVPDAHAVGGAVAAGDAEEVTENMKEEDTIADGEAVKRSAVPLGAPEGEPAALEGEAHAEPLAVLLALPEAVGGGLAVGGEEPLRDASGVAHARGVALCEAEARPETEPGSVAEAGEEADTVSVAGELLGGGEALAVPAPVCD